MSQNSDFVIENGVLTEYNGPGGDVVIPDGVKEIGNGAFRDCTGLTSVVIPDGVTYVGWGVFSGCTGLTSVKIPGSVTEMDGFAFSDCTGLTSITIPESLTEIDDSVFDGCENFTIHAPAGSAAEEYAIANNIPFEAVSEAICKEKGTEIKELVNAWSDFNNTLSEEEVFDENAFDPLFEETKQVAREICSKGSFCRGDMRLVHELTRFVYKEIYSEEQDAAQEQVWTYLNALLAWGPLPA